MLGSMTNLLDEGSRPESRSEHGTADIAVVGKARDE
jgi:hypothetical protein